MSDTPSDPPVEQPPAPLSVPPGVPTGEATSPLAQRPTISPDGLWWWDGKNWQPTDLQLRRAQAQPQPPQYGYQGNPAYPPPVQVTQSSGAGNPFFSGLFGCFGVGAAVVILIVFAVIAMGVCSAAALHSVPSPSP